MTASGSVVAGRKYHIKLVIADRFDINMDSSVFIEVSSFDIGNVDLGSDYLESNKTALYFRYTHLITSGLPKQGYTISWLKDDVAIPNQTAPDLLVSGAGVYTLLAHNNNSDCDFTDSVVIEYYPDKLSVPTFETQNILLSPNPASDIIRVRLQNSIETLDNIVIYDLLGNVVQKVNRINTNEAKINVERLG